jgi:hypothetical protein
MNVQEIISHLKSISYSYPWCEGDDLNDMVAISPDGLYEKSSPYASAVAGPYLISSNDLEGVRKFGSDYQIADSEIDVDEALEMLKSGCKPDIKYYKWGEDLPEGDGYYERDEMMSMYEDLFLEHGHPIPWEDIAEEHLEEYLQVVKNREIVQ